MTVTGSRTLCGNFYRQSTSHEAVPTSYESGHVLLLLKRGLCLNNIMDEFLCSKMWHGTNLLTASISLNVHSCLDDHVVKFGRYIIFISIETTQKCPTLLSDFAESFWPEWVYSRFFGLLVRSTGERAGIPFSDVGNATSDDDGRKAEKWMHRMLRVCPSMRAFTWKFLHQRRLLWPHLSLKLYSYLWCCSMWKNVMGPVVQIISSYAAYKPLVVVFALLLLLFEDFLRAGLFPNERSPWKQSTHLSKAKPLDVCCLHCFPVSWPVGITNSSPTENILKTNTNELFSPRPSGRWQMSNKSGWFDFQFPGSMPTLNNLTEMHHTAV